MKGYKYTRVWLIDYTLVVAPTIEEAIAVYKTCIGESADEPLSVTAIGNQRTPEGYDAIISNEG